jgi:phosphopantothenoylcysteine decarboxylase/phosphopantothenate--cysteine ligase
VSTLRPKVTVGVSGGIAAYKALDLVRALQQANFDPHVVLTRAAEEFVRPLTFAALTGHKVITTLWPSDSESEPDSDDATGNASVEDSAIEHIAEAQSTRLLIVAPATAHTLAKFAHGLADDFLTTLYLATTAPVLLAPAMNVNMFNHPATQANLALLAQRGATIIPPGSGYLACGMTGSGRLADTPTLVAAVLKALEATPAPTQDLTAETILITAGGTREPLDPVRFLGNRSSGKMGYALATAALARGARVTLISAPTALTPPPGATFIPVTTAEEMRSAVLSHLASDCATALIGAAAVSDFRPAAVAPQKLRRTGSFTLTLEPTPDILAEAAEAISSHSSRSSRQKNTPRPLLIAFAAETDSAEAISNGRAKLLRKRADAIVINDVSLPHLGFDSDNNAATLLTATTQLDLPPMPKLTLAHRILDQLLNLRAQ